MPKIQYALVSLLCCLILLRFFLLSEVPVDSGDGLAHFFIAQQVWQNPTELLNHWGKPFFTLLSAPWAYFGYKTYILFNVMIYAASTALGYLNLKRLGLRGLLAFVFPIALLTSIDYTSNILGGMTEVLFGFLILLSGYLMLIKRWIWFAFVVSLMPFSRSEGQFLIPIAVLILIYYKQWKAVPFIASAFFIYAGFGYFALDDFWWYFTQNPYTGAAHIYGKGTWTHYIDYWHVHLGVIGLVLLSICVPAFIWLIGKRKMSKEKVSIVVYFAVIYFGILFVHMYLWATGKNGALGLTRLAIHGWPGLVLACLIVLDEFSSNRKLNTAIAGLSTACSFWLIFNFPMVHEQPFPRKAQPDESAVLDAARFVQERVDNGQIHRVFYYHPLVAYKVGSNLKDKSGVYVQQSFANFDEVFQELESSDCIILDSHFGERDMNFPFEKLDLFDEMAVFTPLNQYVHAGSPIAQVKVLRIRTETTGKRRNEVLFEEGITVFSDSLYTRVLDIATSSFVHASQQFTFSVQTEKANRENLFLVLQCDKSGESLTFELDGLQVWSFSLQKGMENRYKVFIHNPYSNAGVTKIRIERIFSAN